jgi:hypothetical protein
VNNPAPRSPDVLLTELSLRLGQGADACDTGDQGWLLAPLMALIVGWLREIAETLARLADLTRDGEIDPRVSAPRQGGNRPGGKPGQRPTRSPSPPRPTPAAVATPRSHAPRASIANAAAPPAGSRRSNDPPRRVRVLAQAPPKQKTALAKLARWHAHNVTI